MPFIYALLLLRINFALGLLTAIKEKANDARIHQIKYFSYSLKNI